jgi:hypothetical protein
MARLSNRRQQARLYSYTGPNTSNRLPAQRILHPARKLGREETTLINVPADAQNGRRRLYDCRLVPATTGPSSRGRFRPIRNRYRYTLLTSGSEAGPSYEIRGQTAALRDINSTRFE